MNAAVKNLVDRDVNFFLHLGNKIHVSIKTGIYCIDIRRYWFPRDKDELVHGFPSISLKLREFSNLKDRLEEINSFVCLDQVTSCTHPTEAQKLACEQCTVIR